MKKKDFKLITCIAYDFDGVMTDNRVLVTENGNEAVFCNRGDGLAIAKFKELGIKQIIVSAETNSVVGARAKKLGIEVVHGIKDKGSVIKAFCSEKDIDPSSILFVGNDVNDLPAFKVVGMTGAPADAEKEILSIADWVSSRKGGYGVIRELYSHYINALEQKGKM